MKIYASLEELVSALHLNSINTPDEFDSIFDDIAYSLFNNFAIRRGEKLYRFVEIEFYHSLADDLDGKTLKRDSKAGDWFFHDYGVDIAFESDDTRYGGILIRSIVEGDSYENGEIFTNGPRNSFWEIFDQLSAVNGNQHYPLVIESHTDVEIRPIKSLRWPFGGNKKYRYSIPAIYWKDHKKYKAFPTE